MPREMIPSVDIDEGELAPLGVQVTWAPERDLRVATTTHHMRSMWWQCLGHERGLSTLGAMIVDIAAKPATDFERGEMLLNAIDVEFSPLDGLYVAMDRRSVNQLIKLLRRARDGAFGRDE